MPENKLRPGVGPWLALVVIPSIALIGLQLDQVLSGRAVFSSAGLGLLIVLAMLIGTTSWMVIELRHSARARSAQLLEESQFRILVDGLADHGLYLLDPNGYVTRWNASAERLKGYASEEILGKHFSRFFTEADQQAGVPPKALEAAAREGKFELEGWRVRKDGTHFYASAVITALRSREGALIGFAKITRDITERQRHQEALHQAQAALVQSQKMEALGQLTGGMAHDFNNMLHVIKNAMDMISSRIRELDPSVLKYLEMARRNADRAVGITQRLLAYARQQPLDPKPILPNKLIQSMTDMLHHVVGEGVAVETVFGSGLWSVSADPNQLETAILNLTINSRDAMQRLGKLTLETANSFLDESYCRVHTEVTPGQYVMIAISDTGSGMTPEVMARAFDPFFTTKPAGEGTGLGLSQVFGFVKQSGGHIKIYSEVGQGTTIKLYLPRVQSEGKSSPLEIAAPAPGVASAETILVVEDHEEVRAFTVEMLSAMGYRVFAAGDAVSALQTLESLPELELLFTDVGLPHGLNGRQLADQVRALRPRARVLFTTGYARNAIVHHGRLDPGVDLIVKPFSQLDLARKVQQILQRSSNTPVAGVEG
jgi:PAS domain S-box-containing protein